MSVFTQSPSKVAQIPNTYLNEFYESYLQHVTPQSFYMFLSKFNRPMTEQSKYMNSFTVDEQCAMISVLIFGLMRFITIETESNNTVTEYNIPGRMRDMWFAYRNQLAERGVTLSWPQIMFYTNHVYLLNSEHKLDFGRYGFDPVLLSKNSDEEAEFFRKIILVEFFAHHKKTHPGDTQHDAFVTNVIASISQESFVRYYKEMINLLVHKLAAPFHDLRDDLKALPFRFMSEELNDYFSQHFDNNFIYEVDAV